MEVDDYEPKVKMLKLDSATSSLLRKGQVINKLSDVVRELVDNAIDSKCSRVQVLLDNYGLKQIEVRDDGHGIPADKFRQVISGGYSSKLPNDELLSCGQEYGFRGEALSSICYYATVSILTKTASDTYGTRYTLDDKGKVISEGPGPISKGTHVKITDLFTKYPVRRNYIQEKNRCVNELKEIESYLKTLALANPSIHLSLVHNGSAIWSKPSVVCLDQAIIHVFSIFVANELQKCGPYAIPTSTPGSSSGRLSTIELFTPKTPINTKLMTQSTNKLTFILINRRRVYVRELEKLLQDYVEAANESTQSTTTRFPLAVLKIQVPPEQVDFNRSIDKSKVFLEHKTEIVSKLDDILYEYYKVDINVAKKSSQKTPEKQTGKSKVPFSDINSNFDESTVIPCGPEADRLVPSILPNAGGATLEKRSENVMSFLEGIPVASKSNFTSPVKTPPFTKRIPGVGSSDLSSTTSDIIRTPTNTVLRAPGPTKGFISNFNIELDLASQSQSVESVVPSTTNSGTIPNSAQPPLYTVPDLRLSVDENEWVHGRLKDPMGNIIESTAVLVGNKARESIANTTTKKQLHPKESRSVPTTPKLGRLRECTFYSPPPPPITATTTTPIPKILQEKRENLMSKLAVCHSFPRTESTPILLAQPPPPRKRTTKIPLFNRPPSEDDIIVCPGSQRMPRQVTLESLRNWKTPSSSFDKTNSVRTSISQSELFGNNGPPRSPIGIVSRHESYFPPRIPASVKSYLDKRNEGIEFVNSKEIRLDKPKKRTNPPPPSEQVECKTSVVCILPDKSLYIVRINNMIGAFHPANFLEMEPTIKDSIPAFLYGPANEEFSSECVETLLEKFTTLSCEDYSEDVVKQVFHLLQDLDELQPSKRKSLASASS